jgi:hypothetical protein
LTCDKWIKEKEEQNRLREILMNEALEVVGKYNKKDLQLKVLYIYNIMLILSLHIISNFHRSTN